MRDESVMLIKAAINGARTRAECPALPVSPEQQARAAAGRTDQPARPGRRVPGTESLATRPGAADAWQPPGWGDGR